MCMCERVCVWHNISLRTFYMCCFSSFRCYAWVAFRRRRHHYFFWHLNNITYPFWRTPNEQKRMIAYNFRCTLSIRAFLCFHLALPLSFLLSFFCIFFSLLSYELAIWVLRPTNGPKPKSQSAGHKSERRTWGGKYCKENEIAMCAISMREGQGWR